MTSRRRSQDEIDEEVRTRDPIQHVTHRTTTFKEFKSIGPPEFRNTTEPIEAQTWVMEIEKHFLVTNVSEDQKTNFAAFFLKGEASFWWEANKPRAGEGIIPWDRFKELFFSNYFPQTTKDLMEIRFLDLKQDTMSVSQYTAKFNELSRFAPHQVDTEERKTKRYAGGLKPQIRNKVAALKVKTFSEVLETTVIVENENIKLRQSQKDKRNNRKMEGSNHNKRKLDATSLNNQTIVGKQSKNKLNRYQKCKTCSKNHKGVCIYKILTCYNCNQEGHYVSECPHPKTTRFTNNPRPPIVITPRNQTHGGRQTSTSQQRNGRN